MKCDHLIGRTFNGEVYVLASEAMEAIAELKKKLMPCLNGDCILTCEVVEKYGKENAELKAKLEDAKATAYAESVDAGMENRRLKRALWLARAERANDKARIFYFAETCGVKLNIDGYSNKEKGHTRMCTARLWRITWLKVERKCRAMADKWR
jgi:hypothetical protein